MSGEIVVIQTPAGTPSSSTPVIITEGQGRPGIKGDIGAAGLTLRSTDGHPGGGVFTGDITPNTVYSVIAGDIWITKGYNPQGITSSRPTDAVIGDQFYDTSLQKPIWFNGTLWKDASGTAV